MSINVFIITIIAINIFIITSIFNQQYKVTLPISANI